MSGSAVTPWIEKWLLAGLLVNIILGLVFILYGSTSARKASEDAEQSRKLLCEVVEQSTVAAPENTELRRVLTENCKE